MTSMNLRIALAAAAFVLAGPALAQSPSAPATPPAPAAKSTQPATPAGATAPSQDHRARPATGAKDAPSGAAKGGPGGAAASTGAGQQPAGGAARTATPRPARQKGDQQAGRGLQNAYADVMTPEELVAHRTKVKSLKTYDDCRALFEATGKEMEVRAKAQNKPARPSPSELCDRAKERGRVTG